MTGLSKIPDDVKWRIAAEFSAQLPAFYDMAFREIAGAKYDEAEQEVWMEASRWIFTIAKDLALPVSTPADLAESLRIILAILFGPEFKSETLEISRDGAVIIIRRCPLLAESNETGTGGSRTFRKCMAFLLTGTPRLNRDFSARFVRTMCTGDRQCEIKIAKEAADKPAGS